MDAKTVHVTVTKAEQRDVRLLAAQRGQTLRELISGLLRREFAKGLPAHLLPASAG